MFDYFTPSAPRVVRDLDTLAAPGVPSPGETIESLRADLETTRRVVGEASRTLGALPGESLTQAAERVALRLKESQALVGRVRAGLFRALDNGPGLASASTDALVGQVEILASDARSGRVPTIRERKIAALEAKLRAIESILR